MSATAGNFSTPQRMPPNMWKRKGELSVVVFSVLSVMMAMFGGCVLGVAMVDAHHALCVERQSSSSLLCKIMPSQQSSQRSPSNARRSRSALSTENYPATQGSQSSSTITDRNNNPQTQIASSSQAPTPFSMDRIKPLVIEVGVFAVLQTLGVGLMKRAGTLVAKAPWVDAVRRMRVLSGNSLKILTKLYKKTGASKIVTRVKKQVGHALHSSHDHHHDGDHHDDHDYHPSHEEHKDKSHSAKEEEEVHHETA